MGKRRLSLRQQRRIGTGHAQALAQSQEAADSELREGVVTARFGKDVEIVDAGHLDGPARRCHLRANLEPVVGDRVLWQAEQNQGVVTALAPRRSLLRRRENSRVRVIAANIDRIAIVIAPRPEPHAALVDRFLAAAEIERIQALLVINKCDLPGSELAEEIGESRARIGYPLLRVSAHTGLGIDDLRAHLAGSLSIFCGQSGVGKSSLLNRLFPDAGAAVGELSQAAVKGRHTTTVARFYALPGGAVIDAPGIREFDVACADDDHLLRGFVELLPLASRCRFRNCGHRVDAGCALIEAARRGEIDPQRLESFHQLRRPERTAH